MKLFNNVIPGQDAACILLYGEIGWQDKVDAASVVSELMAIVKQYRRVDVRINSLGGEVFSGIAISNALRSVEADINIYVDGVAASIAAVIALCGKPLHMSRFSRLMLHQVSGGTYGTADQMREAAKSIEAVTDNIAELIAGKCRMSAEDVRAKYFSGGDHWIGAKEALDMGLVDSIYDMAATPDPSADPRGIYEFTNRLKDQPQKDNIDMTLLEMLKARPSFKNAADENAVMAHIVKLEEEAAKVPALQNRISELETSVADSRKAVHEALLRNAVREGRIQESQKEIYLNLLKNDEEMTMKLLDSLPVKKASIKDFIATGAAGSDAAGLAGMSWDEIDRANRLGELKDRYPDLYRAKFKESFGTEAE